MRRQSRLHKAVNPLWVGGTSGFPRCEPEFPRHEQGDRLANKGYERGRLPVHAEFSDLRKWAFGLIAFGGLAGATGIILAALAAHGSGGPLLETAANFLLMHAPAIVAIAVAAILAPRSGRWFVSAAVLILLGSVLFCGDLALRALAAIRAFPMAAPIGATLMILGWVQLVAASLKELAAKPF
jgi:uncharacterized membrane protein YgdD (TMEM256/DUF423 family)